MSSPDRAFRVAPWNHYQAVNLVPAGATIATLSGDHELMLHPYVGENLAHPLRVLATPADQSAQALANEAARRHISYVVIDDTTSPAMTSGVTRSSTPTTSPLARSVEADITQFRLLTSGNRVGAGANLYQVGQFSPCGAPTISVTSIVEHPDGTITAAAHLAGHCGPLKGIPVDVWRGSPDVPVWQGSDKNIATLASGPSADVRLHRKELGPPPPLLPISSRLVRPAELRPGRLVTLWRLPTPPPQQTPGPPKPLPGPGR